RRLNKGIISRSRVGFVHGVMNTDNMSILGLTIDYGPYGWVDNFDLHWTPNTTDAEGLRYCFGRQPAIARWNLQRLAEALATVIPDQAIFSEGITEFDEVFALEMGNMLAAKLGWQQWQPEDGELVNRLFDLLQQAEVDMTLFFRRLAYLDVTQPDLSLLAEAFYRDDLLAQHQPALTQWLNDYSQRVLSEGILPEDRAARMNQVNPVYVLRNYLAQQVIEAAEQGDYQPIAELLAVLRHPYTEQPGKAAYAQKRPDWARHKPGCSMLSCSS
ncbi:MAG: protein adenylyltransferase SelO family protein, partial [Tolumonas sp.]|nr:protein adenylyltransferase SelO family protein [Tolumonas sp.]